MTGHTAGHSLQFSLHGDDQLQTGLAPPDIPPDLSEYLQTGPGVLSCCQSSQFSAGAVSVERLAHCHRDQEEGQEEDGGNGGGGLHDGGEARTRTDG